MFYLLPFPGGLLACSVFPGDQEGSLFLHLTSEKLAGGGVSTGLISCFLLRMGSSGPCCHSLLQAFLVSLK